MIGARTPFRISFAGGGSDLASYYRRSPGAVLSTAINKYMYIFVHSHFSEQIQIKYSRTELVDSIDDISHPIVREVLRGFDLNALDINSIADVPAGTGLGSSSSFTVSLLLALHTFVGTPVSPQQLAREACNIEIDILGEPIGKQDQYAASFGGLNYISFCPDGEVIVEPVLLEDGSMQALDESLLMFYTGINRSASDVLATQQQNLVNDITKFKMLEQMADLARIMKTNLIHGDIHTFGEAMHEGWELKKSLATGITNPAIDKVYKTALNNGAEGGKILGAGGGGFLLFFCKKENQDKLRRALHAYKELDFRFETGGARIVFDDRN